MRHLFALVAVALVLGSDVPRGEDAATSATLDGEWLIMKVEYRGVQIYSEEDGKRMRFEAGRTSFGVTYRLRPDRGPRAIDLTEAGRTYVGIYELRGDVLLLCINFIEFGMGGQRPFSFATAEGGEVFLYKLRRCRP